MTTAAVEAHTGAGERESLYLQGRRVGSAVTSASNSSTSSRGHAREQVCVCRCLHACVNAHAAYAKARTLAPAHRAVGAD
jgi:hypothetical protein